jgi:hypothetical protein
MGKLSAISASYNQVREKILIFLRRGDYDQE